MATVRQLNYFNDTFTSLSSPVNQGPWNISSLNKLLAVRVRGSLASGAGSIGSGYDPTNAINYGVQMGPAGYTPADVVTSIGIDTWLWTGQTDPGDLLGVWAPSSDTAEGFFIYSISELWRGQWVIGESTDFYLSIGDPFGASITEYNVAGTIEFLHT